MHESCPTCAFLLETFEEVRQAPIRSTFAWCWRPGCQSGMWWTLLVDRGPREICSDSLSTLVSSLLLLLSLIFEVSSWRLELLDLSAFLALPPDPLRQTQLCFHCFHNLAICLAFASVRVARDCPPLFFQERLHNCQKSPPSLSKKRQIIKGVLKKSHFCPKGPNFAFVVTIWGKS